MPEPLPAPPSVPLIEPAPNPATSVGRVVVSRDDFDWGGSDGFSERTEARLGSLGDQVLVGAWFLNPRYTVSAPTVSAGFFQAARHARSRWLKEVRGSISLQRESRSVVARARRAALADTLGLGAEGLHADLSLASLKAEARLVILQDGHLAKQLAFSGIMFIDGEHILPRTWNARADRLLGPERPPRHRPRPRHQGHAGSAPRGSIAPTHRAIDSQEDRQS